MVSCGSLANHDVMLWAGLPRTARRSCRRISDGWAGHFLGRPRTAATSISTSMSRSRRSNSARALNTTYRREAPTSDVFRWRAGQEGGGDPVEAKPAAMSGTDVPGYHRDRPGMSAFARDDDAVCHTYSTYARGVDPFFGVYHWLDRAPKGATRRALVAAPRRVLGAACRSQAQQLLVTRPSAKRAQRCAAAMRMNPAVDRDFEVL